MKIHPVEAKFLHEDGYTDRHYETNDQLLQFCKWWGSDTAQN